MGTSKYIQSGIFQENNGLVVMESEHYLQRLNEAGHSWLTATAQSSYTGSAYLESSPDIDILIPSNEITTSPSAAYAVNVTNPGTYTVWLRGYPANAAADSAYISLNEVEQPLAVTGFAPQSWSWANMATSGNPARLVITTTGLNTVTVWMREDGLRLDRLLLTTDTNYLPTGFGPPESGRYGVDLTIPVVPLSRTIVYTYDGLYRLTNADYSSGQSYAYDYDKVGNRLQQIINGDTTDYLYDAANRLDQLNGQQVYSFDDNGNLTNSDTLTNSWDAANRLISSQRDSSPTVEPIYNGVNDRVGQTVGLTTTNFALDIAAGLPEVIYTSEDEVFLHLPGVIVAENSSGETRYLLSDGLGSIRQAVDENGSLTAYHEFDPYGNPVNNIGGDPYGYTGYW